MTDRCYCVRCRPVIAARYDGPVCEVCGHLVIVGDSITTDGTSWFHEICAPPPGAHRGEG